ncbi:MAG: hypothetical protein V4735_02805 [Pseudomonadota bacterium]
MQNEYVNPVDHSTLSAGGAVAAGAFGGALKSGAKTMLWCVGGFAVLGLLIGTGWLGAGVTALGLAGGSTGGMTVFLGAVGTVLGAGVGALAGAFSGTIAAAFGAGKGAQQASERVSQERGAAKMMDIQMGAYQANVMAKAANDSRYNFPAQGSTMNQASPRIQADALQNLGTVDGQQLQRA